MRVTANGAKSWVAMYRVNGKAVMETIGTVARCRRWRMRRQAARASMEKAARRRQPGCREADRGGPRRDQHVLPAVSAISRPLRPELKPKTAKEWRRIFEHDVLPRWGERSLSEITKGDVLELVNDKAAKRERKRKG